MGPKTFKTTIKNRFTNYKAPQAVEDSPPVSPSSPIEKTLGLEEKNSNENPNGETTGNALAPSPSNGFDMRVSDAEYKNASRAIRTAGWSSVFYLVTTDILGPFSTP